MSNTNYPSATTTTTQTPKNNQGFNKNILIGVLVAALLGTWGYVLYDKNQAKETLQTAQTQSTTYMSERDQLKQMYDEAEMRLDSITGVNNSLQSELDGVKSQLAKEIEAKKSEIRRILNNKNASDADLKKARGLIAELNDKITGLEAEVQRLTGENEQLSAANTQLQSEKAVVEENLKTTTVEKEELTKTVDVGSTFSASNIQIAPVNEKKKGKEKETTTARKVDKLIVSFDVENRIAKSGAADMYITVTTPEGKVFTDPALQSGSLSTRSDGEINYTTKIPIDYEQGTRKSVSFPIRLEDFNKGNYKIEIYHNGFKIGEGTRTLKKGGLFG